VYARKMVVVVDPHPKRMYSLDWTAGKKGDQKKSKQVAKIRKQVVSMGFSQDANGQNVSKNKLSETGDRAGSILSVYGKQANQMGQGGGRLNLASVANAMNDGNGGGETPFRVQFKAPAPLSQPNVPVLQLREVSFRWPGQPSDLWSDVTMTARMGQRIALLGANGQGKSTLVDVMRGALSPRAGEVILGHGVTFSHYSQHSAATLPPQATPLQYLASIFPENTEMELRSVLGSYNVRGKLATHTVCGQLSGGQKARVVFAAAAHASPHILFLDEPTNHLDMTTIAYLSEAVSTFAGVVVLVSHNRDLIMSLGPVSVSFRHLRFCVASRSHALATLSLLRMRSCGKWRTDA
jgi:ATPase subunit of ABC transporter with duplicated ATPase domains